MAWNENHVSVFTTFHTASGNPYKVELSCQAANCAQAETELKVTSTDGTDNGGVLKFRGTMERYDMQAILEWAAKTLKQMRQIQGEYPSPDEEGGGE